MRSGEPELAALLNANEVLVHPHVIGDLACGNLSGRGNVLTLLDALPRVTTANDAEVLYFIERHELMGRGIGYIDAHLLAATRLKAVSSLWTRDKRLRDAAVHLGIDAGRD